MPLDRHQKTIERERKLNPNLHKGQTSTGYQDYLNRLRANKAKAEAQRRAKEQAYAEAQRKRAEQAQAKAKADAKRRQAELLAKQQADLRQKRTEGMMKRRLERRRMHTIGKKDTPESIAEKYQTTPQRVVADAGVTKFIAGQSIPVFEPYKPIGPQLGVQETDLSAYNAQRKAQATGQGYQVKPDFYTQAGELQAQGERQYQEFFTADPKVITDRPDAALYPDQRPDTGQPLTNEDKAEALALAEADALREKRSTADMQAYIEYLGSRDNARAVDYAYNQALETGDWESSRRILMGTKRDPETGKYVPDEEKWLTFTEREWSLLPSTQKQQLTDMLWQFNPVSGLYEPLILEDAGYGMGGYGYPGGGYGGYGGFGGGDWKEPTIGSRMYRDITLGSRARVKVAPLTAGSLPPAHWRI